MNGLGTRLQYRYMNLCSEPRSQAQAVESLETRLSLTIKFDTATSLLYIEDFWSALLRLHAWHSPL